MKPVAPKKEDARSDKEKQKAPFADPFQNRLNLRCQRDRPRVRQVKVS